MVILLQWWVVSNTFHVIGNTLKGMTGSNENGIIVSLIQCNIPYYISIWSDW